MKLGMANLLLFLHDSVIVRELELLSHAARAP